MGLDVYLYRYDDFEDYQRRSKQAEQMSDELYAAAGGYDNMGEKARLRVGTETASIRMKLGVEWGHEVGLAKIEEHSAKHPEHMFKVGYFRSSYNGGGIQNVLQNAIGVRPLDYIFDPPKPDAYEFPPDWAAARLRCLAVMDQWNSHTQECPYRVTTERHNPFLPTGPTATSENAALQVFKQHRDKRRKRLEQAEREGQPNHEETFGSAYSCSEGSFFLGEPMKVAAIIPGQEKSFLDGSQVPVMYVVYECDDNDWYAHALEIVLETIDYVLAQPDPEKYYLHWSG